MARLLNSIILRIFHSDLESYMVIGGPGCSALYKKEKKLERTEHGKAHQEIQVQV